MTRFATKNDMNTYSDQTVNLAWGHAYKLSLENELLWAVVTNFFADNFYEAWNERLVRIQWLIKELAFKNPAFLMWLSVYVRKVYHMRTMSHIIIAELSRYFNWTNSYFSDLVADSIERVDDMVEILWYLLPEGKRNKKAKSGALSHSLIKWLAKAFNKFDEYQLSKYDRDYSINLKDVIRIIHPNSPLAVKVLKWELASAYTWERELSAIPKSDENYTYKAVSVFYNLLAEHKLWYMALLKNLRKISDLANDYAYTDRKVADDLIEMAYSFLTNDKAIENSKQMPFRFLSAYRNLPINVYTNRLKEALNIAASYSVRNVQLSDRIAVFADVSSSMNSKISDKSTVANIDIWLMYTWIASSVAKYWIAWVFWDNVKLKSVNWVFWLNDSYKDSEVWYSTHWYKAIDLLSDENTFVDTIMFFSDDQMYGSSSDVNAVEESLKRYKANVNPNVKVFIFDVSWYGTKVSNKNNVYLVQGWSDKIFEYVNILDSYTDNTTVNEITNYGVNYLK